MKEVNISVCSMNCCLMGPITGLLFLQRNHTVLDVRQGVLNFPFFPMRLKTADHRYSNVLEAILNPTEITIPPNDRVLIRTNFLIYPENAVTGILQPSDRLHEEGDITALVTLTDGNIHKPVNNFTNHPYKLKKGLHIANCSVITPEQMNYVKPVDPVSTWHLLQKTRSRQPTMLAVISRQAKIHKTLKIIGFLLQRILGTPTNTRLYKKNPT